MKSESTTALAGSANPPTTLELRPLDWWANLDPSPELIEPQRRTPPIPAFVRLSRLVNPELTARSRNAELTNRPAAALPGGRRATTEGDRTVSESVSESKHRAGSAPVEAVAGAGRRRGWIESAGRPLFRIGLAAIVAAAIAGVLAFESSGETVSTGDSPETTVVDPGTGEQARGVLDALARQTGGGAEADMSIVGTASGGGTEIRWTATVRNQGPGAATGPITIVHTIGSEFELVSTAGTGWTCEHRRAARTITCQLDEDLANGQRRRLGIVTTNGGVQSGARVPSTMSVVAPTTDPDLDNNSINVTAVSGPVDESDEPRRSRSTGAAGQANNASDSGQDVDAAVAASSPAGGSGTAELAELPRTGSGLAVALGGIGATLCLAGRRMTGWSARAQTRTLLVAANIS